MSELRKRIVLSLSYGEKNKPLFVPYINNFLDEIFIVVEFQSECRRNGFDPISANNCLELFNGYSGTTYLTKERHFTALEYRLIIISGPINVSHSNEFVGKKIGRITSSVPI